MNADVFDLLGDRYRCLVRMLYRRGSAVPRDRPMAYARLVDVTPCAGVLLVRETPVDPRTSELLLEQCHASSGEQPATRSTDLSAVSTRRGEAPPATGWDMLTAMGSPSLESEASSDAAPSPDGLSAFVARVLNQLTLSAWLPASVLTASLAVLLEFRSARSANVLHAVGALTADPVRVLVIMIPLLVIATVVTQAFAFETIKTLEGYWRRRGLATGARTLMIWWHSSRKASIDKRLRAAYGKALDAAKNRIREDGVPESVFNAFRDSMTGAKNKTPLTADLKRELIVFKSNWRSYCRPWHLVKIDQLLNDKALYPDDDRILPTKLGNMMRATEDRLTNAKDDVEGFVLRRYAVAARRVQLQHDEFRNRMEMYCTLVFVSGSLAVLAPAILIGSGVSPLDIGIVAAAFAALCVASYHAAVASAGGYCAALKEMDKDQSVTEHAD